MCSSAQFHFLLLFGLLARPTGKQENYNQRTETHIATPHSRTHHGLCRSEFARKVLHSELSVDFISIWFDANANGLNYWNRAQRLRAPPADSFVLLLFCFYLHKKDPKIEKFWKIKKSKIAQRKNVWKIKKKMETNDFSKNADYNYFNIWMDDFNAELCKVMNSKIQ